MSARGSGRCRAMRARNRDDEDVPVRQPTRMIPIPRPVSKGRPFTKANAKVLGARGGRCKSPAKTAAAGRNIRRRWAAIPSAENAAARPRPSIRPLPSASASTLAAGRADGLLDNGMSVSRTSSDAADLSGRSAGPAGPGAYVRIAQGALALLPARRSRPYSPPRGSSWRFQSPGRDAAGIYHLGAPRPGAEWPSSESNIQQEE